LNQEKTVPPFHGKKRIQIVFRIPFWQFLARACRFAGDLFQEGLENHYARLTPEAQNALVGAGAERTLVLRTRQVIATVNPHEIFPRSGASV